MKKQLPGWAVLLIITLVAGLALGGTNALTKDPIAQQALIKAENARKAALPDAASFEELELAEGAPVDWVYAGIKDGAAIGYVAQKTVNGFGGKVEVIAGVDTKDAPETFTIGGVTVGGSDFSETAGLGAKAKEPAFTGQFPGKVYPISYIKAGGEATESTVDALTSATITTTAVVNGVNDIVKYVKADVLGIAGVEMPAKPADGVFSASEKGFRGPVYVEAAFDNSGKVTYIDVGDENFAEDIGVGVVEPDFMIQFIGKQMPLEVADIDVIAGATISSTAVVKALNTAYAVAGGAEIVVPETPTMPEKPAEGVFSAAEKGFAGPVYVEAAFDEDGKITYLGVGDDQFAETEGFGARALEPEEQYPFIGAQMPLELGDVDALTGATFTKTAIVNGLNKAYAASKGEVIEEPVVEEITLPEKPAEGVFSAAEKGFAGPVYVEAAFDEAGKITYLGVGDDQFAETEGFGARALEPEEQYPFIGAQMPLELGDVDALTGATFTKTAIVNGLNKAYAASKGEIEEEPAAEPAKEETPDETKALTENAVTATAQGFGGPVAVEAVFDGDKIVSVKIGDENFAETPGLGARALEEEFQAQFAGKQMPLTLADIDAIAGATITSTAVVDALNEAYTSIQTNGAEPGQGAEYTEETNARNTVLKIAASFDGSKLTALTIEPADIEAEMQEKFVGAEMPVSVDQADSNALTVAVALNKAYDRYLAEQPETEPAAEPAEEPAETNAASTMVLRVTAEFEGDTLSALTVLEKAPDEEVYSPCPEEEALKAKFIGQTLPLETNQSSRHDSVVAIAINKAYYNAAHEADAEQGKAGEETDVGIIGGADGPTDVLVAENGDDGEPSFTGEAISFFTAIRASVKITPAFTVEAVSFEEKAVGAEEYQPSEQNGRLEALFVGEELPLDVKAYDDAFEAAAAIAINEAFEQSPYLLAYNFNNNLIGVGESVSFFTQYTAAAAFDNGALTAFGVFKAPVGNDDAAEAVDCDALRALLIGQEMPLNATDYLAAGMPEYEVTAVVIALNQAYENALAGLQ